MSETLHERIAYYVYANASRLAVSLPESAGRFVFQSGARLAERFGSKSRETVAANLARVLGQPADSSLVRRAVHEAFSLYGRYWHESFRFGSMREEEFEKRMNAEGFEHVDEALEKGKGAILVAPHMGNWDAAGRWLGLRDYNVITVAEALKPERLLQMFLRQREAFGIEVLPLRANGGVGKRLGERLAENWVVGLVADRDLTGRGVEVEMFGATRSLPAGPAVLSLNSGAPLHVAGLYTTKHGWRARAGPALSIEKTGDMKTDVAALTREMGREFERAIAAAPSDWHMFQPAWKQQS
jgi:KDO2-lipid IV(A) lauroyltransferase